MVSLPCLECATAGILPQRRERIRMQDGAGLILPGKSMISAGDTVLSAGKPRLKKNLMYI
jgi:hypothetical protein